MKVFDEFYDHLNNTFITLKPKKKRVAKLRDFHPISLLSSVYKIIYKLLVSRLKGVMSRIISPPQGAFIEDRQVLDGVLIANECIEDRGVMGHSGVICKLGLEKTYDHVNWRFLDYILKRMGFGSKWKKWISFCLQSSSFLVLINGCPSGFFGELRRLRQGDPLSPFLFIMVSEVLSRMISRAEMRYISGFKISRGGGVTISHFQFVDDTMIICEVDMGQIGYLRCILTCFEVVSGLKINLDKSVLFQVGDE